MRKAKVRFFIYEKDDTYSEIPASRMRETQGDYGFIIDDIFIDGEYVVHVYLQIERDMQGLKTDELVRGHVLQCKKHLWRHVRKNG